jgi:hypothetical protein
LAPRIFWRLRPRHMQTTRSSLRVGSSTYSSKSIGRRSPALHATGNPSLLRRAREFRRHKYMAGNPSMDERKHMGQRLLAHATRNRRPRAGGIIKESSTGTGRPGAKDLNAADNPATASPLHEEAVAQERLPEQLPVP